MKRIIYIFILVLFLFGLLSGCNKDAKSTRLTISAASSLKDSMEDIKQVYSKRNPNVIIVYNFGSSGSLQQQIEQGADVDIFISAAVKQMKVLEEKQLLVPDTKVNLLRNSVVLVVPIDAAGIDGFSDLSGDNVKKIAIGEPKSVPAGQYAQEVFIKLNIYENIKSKLVFGNNVKQVLTWVETGNADAGVVYETDAKASSKVKIAVSAPEDTHEPVLYPAAVIKTSKNIGPANEFMKYLLSKEAKTVFEKYGFVNGEGTHLKVIGDTPSNP
jgi:molybdate transport system substrate-binding protein